MSASPGSYGAAGWKVAGPGSGTDRVADGARSPCGPGLPGSLVAVTPISGLPGAFTENVNDVVVTRASVSASGRLRGDAPSATGMTIGAPVGAAVGAVTVRLVVSPTSDQAPSPGIIVSQSSVTGDVAAPAGGAATRTVAVTAASSAPTYVVRRLDETRSSPRPRPVARRHGRVTVPRSTSER